MLALSDRLLLRLRGPPRTARELARDLGADVAVIHRMLRRFEADGVAERDERDAIGWNGGPGWRMAAGVRVDLQPARLIVTGARPRTAGRENRARCGALSKRGSPCKLPTRQGDRCVFHQPQESVPGMDAPPTQPPSWTTAQEA